MMLGIGRRVVEGVWMVGVLLLAGAVVPSAVACGGFFCQLVPIDQAGEQIIFRQDGTDITAVVLIQYTGAAEEFSWVVPVPGIPEVEVGSDLVFTSLEQATRPQFDLTVNGSPCDQPVNLFPTAPEFAAGDSADDGDSGVEVLERFAVGPFDVEVISSDDAEALATWLIENEYDLTDRGRELIEPYVEQGMNFVGVKLQQNQGVGDIQPLILRYQSEKPMIPIRLTAVAATADMGVITWILGPARAVPDNYLAVEVNYTLLNWYFGSTNAYASYQGLVTAAMNEAGGQGFATDYAGRDRAFVELLPVPEDFETELSRLSALETEQFYRELSFGFVFPSTKVMEILRRQLPLPEGIQEFVYSDGALLREVFSAEEIASAKDAIIAELRMTVVEPLGRTIDVLDDELYMTRLYTTLSPEEMTVDPTFVFNSELQDQAVERSATLNLACNLGTTEWSLTLGAGTGRDGETVIRGFGDSPTFAGPPALDQPSVATTARLRATGGPEFVDVNDFELATVGEAPANPITSILSMCGNGTMTAAMVSLGCVGLISRSRRRRS